MDSNKKLEDIINFYQEPGFVYPESRNMQLAYNKGGLATPKRGLVDEPGSYAGQAVISNPSEFIQEVKIGNKIKYIVRHRIQEKGKRKTVAEGYFNTLEAAEKFRDENLSEYMGKKLTQEKFKELRLKNKDLTAKEFADYLNKETSYKPSANALKFTEGNVLNFHTRTGLPSPSTISEEIKTKIYNDYIKGETNLSDLGRKYFGDEKGLTNNARQRRVFSILVGKGVDRSKFRKNFPLKEGEVTSRLKTQYTRKKRINEALNKAGKKTKTQYLDLERKILSLNDDILKMSDNEILNNKFLMKALNVDASKNNLAKGKITFDKYANLSPKEQVAKIRDLAKRRLFFQPEHIREVATELQNIIYPNNIGVASGKIGPYMTNIKEYVRNNPKGKAIPAIEAFLKEFDMAVSEGNNKLGFKNITYDSKAGTSNVVESIKAKSQILKPPVSGGSNSKKLANLLAKAGFRCGAKDGIPCDRPEAYFKDIEESTKAAKEGKAGAIRKFNNAGNIARKSKGALKVTGLGILAEAGFEGGFVLNDILSGVPVKEAFQKSLFQYVPFTGLGGTKDAEASEMKRIVGKDPRSQQYAADLQSSNELNKLYKDYVTKRDDVFGSYDQDMILDAENKLYSFIKNLDPKTYTRLKFGSPEYEAFEAKQEVEDVNKLKRAMDLDPFKQKRMEIKRSQEPSLEDDYMNLRRAKEIGAIPFEDKMSEIASYGGVANMAGGGIAGIRRPHAIAPESGPAPQGEGLSYLFNRDREW